MFFVLVLGRSTTELKITKESLDGYNAQSERSERAAVTGETGRLTFQFHARAGRAP